MKSAKRTKKSPCLAFLVWVSKFKKITLSVLFSHLQFMESNFLRLWKEDKILENNNVTLENEKIHITSTYVLGYSTNEQGNIYIYIL